MLKGCRLGWADKVALSVALLVAGAAFFFWTLAIIGLWKTQLRFDGYMIMWIIEAELVVALPAWLLSRAIDFVMRTRKKRRLQPNT